MLSSRRALALMAALAFSAGSPPVLATQPAMVSAAPRPVQAAKRIRLGAAYSATGRYGRKGAGISMAKQQRASRKVRNVARSRRR